MKRKRIQKCETDAQHLSVSTPIAPQKEPMPSNPFDLPGLDFSKRSHQAFFWMLLNRVTDDRSNSLKKIYAG